MSTLAVNTVIAAIWLFLSGRRGLGDLIVGFAVGFALLAVFGGVLGSGAYARRGLAWARFLARFGVQFVLANLAVAVMVIGRRKESMHPNFVTYDVTGLTSREILILSYCITLTPGTTTVNVSEDGNTLILHAIDVQDADALRREIDTTLKKPLLEATR